jgi:peptidoglycan L-alanyl-D-glutamate endopeptidase CwlK
MPRCQLEDLHPVLTQKARALIAAARQEQIELLVTSTLRSIDEQARLYALGRISPGGRATNAKPGQSWHHYGLAFDVVPLVAGKPVWSAACWNRIGALGRSLGLVWGGDCRALRDRCHFEYHPGLDLAAARRRLLNRQELLT